MNSEIPPSLVLCPGTRLFEALNDLAKDKAMLFLAGSAGVGKSLLLQQAALLALAAGRRVHLLRWDVVRLSFERSPSAQDYPPRSGVTHAAIRLAVGHWARKAVEDWYALKVSADLLIAECPMVGNRFVELVQRWSDPLETVLAGDSVRFLIPAPTLKVRDQIESLRAREIDNPRHASEAHNAPPKVMNALMDEIQALSKSFGLESEARTQGYHPETYLGVYSKLLRHRPHTTLLIDEVLPVSGSAQVLPAACKELVPTSKHLEASIAWARRFSDEQVQRRVSEWWKV